jgi:hypothetical protein
MKAPMLLLAFLFLVAFVVLFVMAAYWWLVDLGMIALHAIHPAIGVGLLLWGAFSMIALAKYIRICFRAVASGLRVAWLSRAVSK